jgi:thiamine pyrophosphokinase
VSISIKLWKKACSLYFKAINNLIRLKPKSYIFLNGDFERPTPDWPERPIPGDLIVGVDGGASHPATLGWPIHCLVGDLDSLDPLLLAKLEFSDTEISRYPQVKNEIDFELALNMVRWRGYEDIEVLGALGGRWDMTLGNLMLTAGISRGSECIHFRHGPWDIFTVRGPVEFELTGRAGDILSLIPLSGKVSGLYLTNCLYPLNGETLKRGLTRGLSNELTASVAQLLLETGLLMVSYRHC